MGCVATKIPRKKKYYYHSKKNSSKNLQIFRYLYISDALRFQILFLKCNCTEIEEEAKVDKIFHEKDGILLTVFDFFSSQIGASPSVIHISLIQNYR